MRSSAPSPDIANEFQAQDTRRSAIRSQRDLTRAPDPQPGAQRLPSAPECCWCWSGAESSQTAGVLSGIGWWTDTNGRIYQLRELLANANEGVEVIAVVVDEAIA
jgi:hypothetical protein